MRRTGMLVLLWMACAHGAALAIASEPDTPALPDTPATADSPAMADSLAAVAGSLAAARSAASDTLLPAAADSTLDQDPPEDAPADRDYQVERKAQVAPSEVEMGYSLASLSHGRIAQRRRVRYREDGVEAEVREGRGDALAGAALGARVPGG